MHVIGANEAPRVVLSFYLQDQDSGAIPEHRATKVRHDRT
jgi:glutamine synthetase type III